MRSFVLAALSLIVLASCHRTDAPGEAPTGVKVVPGDGVVVVSWDTLPDLTYWIFFSAGISVGVGNPGSFALRGVLPPRVIGGLGNDAPFAFIVNATHGDSPAGPSSVPIVAKGRLAGDTDTWTSGPAIVAPPLAPPQNLKSAASNGSRFVVVGDAATIFAADVNYTSCLPQSPCATVTDFPGVTPWLPPVQPFTLAPTVNLSSVIFNGTFVALGTDSASSTSSPVISSGDGFTWTPNIAVPAGGMNAIGFGGATTDTVLYVAVGDQGRIFTTTNVATVDWTPRNSGTSNALNGVAFLNGRFFATGAAGTLLTSSDGITWDLPLDAKTNNTLRSVTFTPLSPGAQYVAVGDGGVVTTSTDGNTWNAITLASAPDLRSVIVGGASGTRFLAVGSGGAVAFSDDGLPLASSWHQASAGSANLAKVVAVPSMYLGVGDAGANAVSR